MDKPSSSRKSRAKAAPPETPPIDEPLAFDDDCLKRVQDIIRNARATWFALLGALVFASVTLASVKDVSFFVNTVETKLPLVGISVPVVSFFWAGSLLIAALYAYFHLYLELLWQALGDAPARINGKPLADRIEPWIVADTALRLRDRLRNAHGEERCSRKRGMSLISDVVSVSLVWLFGLLVIFWFWWRSMPAHDLSLTGFNGLVLSGTLWVFSHGLLGTIDQLGISRNPKRLGAALGLVIVLVATLTVVRTFVDPWTNSARAQFNREVYCGEHVTFFKCVGDALLHFNPFILARANLSQERISEVPRDWVGRELGETEFRARWCKENPQTKCLFPFISEISEFSEIKEQIFQRTWRRYWAAYLTSIPHPDLGSRDLRTADLTSAHLIGATLNFSALDGADFSMAVLDEAKFWHANGEETDFSLANLSGTEFYEAALNNADFTSANLTNAILSNGEFRRSVLSQANLKRADLSGANFEGSVFGFASLEDTDLRAANISSSNLAGAKLEGIRAFNINLENSNLAFAKILGKRGIHIDFSDAHLKSSNWAYSAAKYIDLSNVDISNLKNFDLSFGDASVKLPSGYLAPCQWGKTDLSNDEFYGRWLGWIDAGGGTQNGLDLFDYMSIPPPSGCEPRETTKTFSSQ